MIKKKDKEEKEEKYVRPTWDQYFLNLVEMVGKRGTCDRGRSGCVIVKDKRILATGYVGSPINTPHCDEVGHEMHTVVGDDEKESRHCIRTTHAEQNAIANAARFGVALEGATIYSHMTPCYSCAKMIINAGIKRSVCNLDYHAGQRTKEIYKQAGVEYILANQRTESYDDM